MRKVALWSGVIWIIIFVGIGIYGLRQRNSYHKDLSLYQENLALYQACQAHFKQELTREKVLQDIDDARRAGLSDSLIWERFKELHPGYQEALSQGMSSEEIKECIFNPVVFPQKPAPSYEILNTILSFSVLAMVFEYLVLVILIGVRKVVRKELIILWSVVIYTIAVISLLGRVNKYGKYSIGVGLPFLLSGWLVAGAAYLTYRIRKR